MASAQQTISGPPEKIAQYETHAEMEGYESFSEFARVALDNQMERDNEDA